jgi:hypothetical protein
MKMVFEGLTFYSLAKKDPQNTSIAHEAYGVTEHKLCPYTPPPETKV